MKLLKAVRNLSPAHTVEIELEVSEHDHWKLQNINEHLRIIRNTVLGVLLKNYNQMTRTKEYKNTLKSYTKVNNLKETKAVKAQKQSLKKKFEELRDKFDVTFNYARKYGEFLRSTKYNLPDAVTTLSVCEMAWDSLEGLLYRKSKKVKFYKRDEFITFQGKQANRSIILKEGLVSFAKMKLPLIVKKNDLFIKETLSHINEYKNNSALIDSKNIENYLNEDPLISTYRVRNNRIVCKEIRGKVRYYLQVVLEGMPVVKRNRDGSFRHTYGVGRLGGDIGSQSLAIFSENKAILQNFAERAEKTFKEERKVHLLQRSLDRSRRIANPNNFDSLGRIKKGPKRWNFSNRYKNIKAKLKDLQRKTAANREYAHNEDINELRSLGNELIIETMDIRSLQKKAKETTVNEKTGKFNKKKRFGKSILNRSPGYFIAQAKERFAATGGIVKEVNTWSFKASQYDHVLDDTNKKGLSARWHILPDNTKLQRDLYASFLLYCSKADSQTPDKNLCDVHYPNFKTLHDHCIKELKNNRKVVLNSGIIF